MRVEVTLFGPFRETVGEKTVEIDLPGGSTVDDALAALVEDHADLSGRFRTDGALRGDVNVTVNGKHVRQQDGLATTLDDGDLLRIAPPVKGGSHSVRPRTR